MPNVPSPNPPPGYAAIQAEFTNWETAENLAVALGYQVQEESPSLPWRYLTNEAVAAVRAKMNENAAAYYDARHIDSTYVSCQIVDPHLCFSTWFFAQRLGLTCKKPSESEDEYFVLISDLPAIVAACRASNPNPQNGARNTQAVQDGIVAWANANGPGLTARAYGLQLRAQSGLPY